jgi:hypothetical protein
MMNLKSENNGKLILHDEQLKQIYKTKRQYQKKLTSLIKNPLQTKGSLNITHENNVILCEIKPDKSNCDKPEVYQTKEISVGTADIHTHRDSNYDPNGHVLIQSLNLPVHNLHAESGLQNFRYHKSSRRSSLYTSFESTRISNADYRLPMTRCSYRTRSGLSTETKPGKLAEIDESAALTKQTSSLEGTMDPSLFKNPSSSYKPLRGFRPRSVGYTSRSRFPSASQARKACQFIRLEMH